MMGGREPPIDLYKQNEVNTGQVLVSKSVTRGILERYQG